MGYAAKDDMKGCETRWRFLLSLKFSTPGSAICIVIHNPQMESGGRRGRKVELLSKFGHCRAQRRPVEEGGGSGRRGEK